MTYKLKSLIFLICFLCFFVPTQIFAQIVSNLTNDEGCLGVTVELTKTVGAGVWDFGDNATSVEDNPQHIYTDAGVYSVTFTETTSGTIQTLEVQIFDTPTASFVADTTKGCKGLEVKFSDQSVGSDGAEIVKWGWTMGDGTALSSKDPTHVFTFAQDHPIALTIEDENGCTDFVTRESYIITSEKPPVGFVTNPNPPVACEGPLSVAFSNTTTNSSEYSFVWELADGTMIESKDLENQTYTDGNHLVKLTATDGNFCSGEASKQINIGKPKASFIIPDTLCIDQNYQFVNQSSDASYSWDFGDGNSSSSTSPLYKYSTAGTYDVTLTATSNGCFGDTTRTIVVEDPLADFEMVPNPVCNRFDQVAFTDLSTGGNVVKWEWDFGDGNETVGLNPTHVFDYPDSIYPEFNTVNFFAVLKITTSNGCVATTNKKIEFSVPDAEFMPDVAEGCAPLQVVFTDSSEAPGTIVKWNWDFGDGNTQEQTSENPLTHTFQDAGEYDVFLRIEDVDGCVDTSYAITIKVGDKEIPDFSISPTEICSTDDKAEIKLKGSGAPTSDEYTWQYIVGNQSISECSGEEDATFDVFDEGVFDEIGMLDVSLIIDHNGCKSDTIKKINAVTIKGPLAEITSTHDCADKNTFNFTGNIEGTSFEWDLGDGTKNTTDQFIQHTYGNSSKSYTVKLTVSSSDGCPDAVDEIEVATGTTKAVIDIPDNIVCVRSFFELHSDQSSEVDTSCFRGFFWSFGDGQILQTDTNKINHVYQARGEYDVYLVTSDVNNCKDTAWSKVFVKELQVQAAADREYFCSGDVVNFNGSTILADNNVTNWSWTFEDGSIVQGKDISKELITDRSTYRVLLQATDSEGCGGQAFVDLKTSIPNGNFVATPKTICVGEDIQFIGTGAIESYSWQISDGQSAVGSNPKLTFNTAGVFNVEVTFTDSIGCQLTKTQENYITVESYPIAKIDSNLVNPNICFPREYVFTDLTNSTFDYGRVWDLGKGSQSLPISQVTEKYLPGDYQIVLKTETSAGCSDADTISIKVVGPKATFTISNNLICKGDEIQFEVLTLEDANSFEWDFGDGVVVANENPVSHKYEHMVTGQIKAVLKVESTEFNCIGLLDTTIIIRDVLADFTRNQELDTVLCLGDTMNFVNTSLGADIFAWDLGDGSSSDENEFYHIYSDTGTYNVQLKISSDRYGCKDTIVKSVRIQQQLPINLPDYYICKGESVELQPIVGSDITWLRWTSSDTTEVVDSVLFPTVTPLETTVYYFEAENAESCMGSDSSRVVVQESFSDRDSIFNIVIGETITLNGEPSEGFYTFSWDPEEGLSCTDCLYPQAQPLYDTIYKLTIADTLGCNEAVFTYRIIVRDDFTVEVPSTFTPNGDGINDVIYVRGWGIEELKSFIIYNRWGQKVFETTDENIGWDGRFQGELQNNETYVYVVVARGYNGRKPVVLKGSLTLIR